MIIRHWTWLFLFLATPAAACAHPPPPARVVVDLDADAFRLTLHGDIPALVMQAPPGHLGDERAAELRAMSDKELQGWVEDARKAFALRTVVALDGQPVPLEAIEFPDLSEIRQSAVGHNEKGIEGRILCRGKIPKDANTLTLTLPQDVGRVTLTVRRGTETLHSLRLDPGQASPALTLTPTATPEPAPQRPSLVLLALVIAVAVVFYVLAAIRRIRSSW
jgi:hypothetical protein